MLVYIARLLKALNSNEHPGEIAHAVSCGLILGFIPKDNLLWYVLFILFLFIRINKGAFFILFFLGSLLTIFLDPLFDIFGYAVLSIPFIAPLMSSFLNIPLMAYTKLNNSVVMGSLLSGILLYIPAYILGKAFVSIWRSKLSPALAQNAFVKWFVRLPIVKPFLTVYKAVEVVRD